MDSVTAMAKEPPKNGSSILARMEVRPKTCLNVFPNSNPNLSPNFNRNSKALKRFRENEMMSFFGKVSRYPQ